MKKYMILLSALLAAACTSEQMPGEKELPLTGRQALTFVADATATKTSLGDDWSVSWCEGDLVKIIWNGGEAVCEAVLKEGKAYFSAVVDEVSEYYAVYPASVPASVSADGRLSITLPASQTGKFEDCAVIMAQTTRKALNFGRFKSAVSMVRFSIENPSVTRVRFSSPDSSPIAGTLAINPDLTYSASADITSVELPVQGKGTYFLSLLPGLSLPGVSFQLGTDEKWLGTASSLTPAALEAGQILLLSAVLEDHLVIEGDIYISTSEELVALLSNPASSSKLDGHTVHLSAGEYNLAVGDKGLSLDFEAATTVKLSGEEGTVFTTSLSGAEGCIITVGSDNVNLDVEGITFKGASHEGTGGALCLTKGSHSFRDCVFSDNVTTATAADKTGGAVYVGGTAAAEFEACTFSGNNTYVTGGGAMAVYTTGVVTVLDCDFTGNTSHNGTSYVGNGGAILQKKAGNILYIVNSRFNGNATNTNGPDIFSSAGAAIFLFNDTFAHPLSPDSKSANRGCIRLNVPAMVAFCTFVTEVDTDAVGAGTSNGLMAFGQNNNNVFVGNLMLSNAGYSMGVGAKYTSSTTKQATTKGYNVYSEAPKLVITDDVHTDLTGIRTADVVASTELSGGYLVWDGPAVKLPALQTASAAYMTTVLKDYPLDGTRFYDWLSEKGVFGKDAAGNTRGTDAWWPGAYQAQ